MSKIYTRTGDKGETSLFTGERVSKNNHYIEALGSIDELNCTLGTAIAFLPEKSAFNDTRQQLIVIQHALFDLGAAVATPRTKAASEKIEKTRFDEEEIFLLEKWIDEMDVVLPKLTTFILPGGDPAGALLHMARGNCRRAERQVVPLNHLSDVSEKIIRYLNRLSDYLFMASRYVNHIAGRPETKWEKHLTTREKSSIH